MSIYGVRNLSAHYNGKKHLKNMADGEVSSVSDPYSFDTDPDPGFWWPDKMYCKKIKKFGLKTTIYLSLSRLV